MSRVIRLGAEQHAYLVSAVKKETTHVVFVRTKSNCPPCKILAPFLTDINEDRCLIVWCGRDADESVWDEKRESLPSSFKAVPYDRRAMFDAVFTGSASPQVVVTKMDNESACSSLCIINPFARFGLLQKQQFPYYIKPGCGMDDGPSVNRALSCVLFVNDMDDFRAADRACDAFAEAGTTFRKWHGEKGETKGADEKQIHNDMLFMVGDDDQMHADPILRFCRMTKLPRPLLCIIDVAHGVKYVRRSKLKITKMAVYTFIENVMDDKVDATRLTQPLK